MRSISNVSAAADSSAIGLSPFMPATAAGVLTTPEKFARMALEQQLDLVERYHKPFKGQLGNLGDLFRPPLAELESELTALAASIAMIGLRRSG